MKNRVIDPMTISFAFLFLIFQAGCSGSKSDEPMANESTAAPVTASAPANKEPAVEAGTSGDISVTVPEGWNKVEGSVLKVQYMKGTVSFMAKTEPFQGDDLDAIVTQAKGIFQKSFENVSFQGKVETLQVDGRDARKIEFTAEVSKMKMKYMYVYLKYGGQTWAITFGGLADSFDALAADYQTILNQTKFQ